MTTEPEAVPAELLRLGLDVAVRIRDEDPAEVLTALDALTTEELQELVLMLARCVDVSLPVSEIVWWQNLTSLPRAPRPDNTPHCGTSRGYKRHLRMKERPDLACEVAYRRDERKRKAQQRPAGDGRG